MPTEKTPQTLRERLSAIDAKNASEPKTEVTKQIAGSKAKRGPGLAGRISGLQKLKPALGQQFYKTNKTQNNEE